MASRRLPPLLPPLPLLVGLLGTLVAMPPPVAAQEINGPAAISRNWSGYVAGNAYYTGVSALIQAPVASAQAPPGVVVSWVGIGGATSDDVIQAGLEVDDYGASRPRYRAWWETLPLPAAYADLEIGPGDWVLIDVHEIEFNRWQVLIVDGEHVFQVEVPYASSHTSAEWIVEDPASATNRLLPLASVAGANFAEMQALANGKALGPRDLAAMPVAMVAHDGAVRALPSPLDAAGTQFTVATR